MEAIGQGRQREITLESLALLKARRRDVQVFNELLVQYPVPGQRKPGQVVPDNMVVLSDKPVRAESSFNLPLDDASPFWVLDYVSRNNKRKDYEDNFDKYEKDLKVPYYLRFYPEDQELTLYHYSGKKYVSVKRNEHGRYAIPELELEAGLLEGWVRFWYQGELLPLPADLQQRLEETKREAEQAKRRAEEETRRADEAARRAAEERQRADELQRQLQATEEARRAIERELEQLRAAGQQPKARRANGPRPSK
jgi:Uma2 family endonuclease